MATRFIGKESVEFAHKYFSQPPTSDGQSCYMKTQILNNPFAELEHANLLDETTLRQAFVSIVNQHQIAPGLGMDTCESVLDASGAGSEMVGPDPQETDLAFWRDGDTLSDRSPRCMDQLVPVVFKSWKFEDNSQDPFHDDPNVSGGVVVSDSQPRMAVLGDIISHAEKVFALQQRLAVFTLLVIGRTCRFLRWDHSGAVVTQAIDYYEDWEFFCDTLWWISQCSDEVLGVDPSAVRLSPEDEDFKAMDRAAIPDPEDVDHAERKLDSVPQAPFTFVYVRDLFRKSLHEQWPRYKLEVPHGNATRHFLVCKPVFCAEGLFGRGTRGYVALDRDTGRFVWLKDVWRAYYLLLEKEGDVLARLNAAEVPYVPTLVCHGDIRDQTTVTSQEWELQNPEPKATRRSTFQASAGEDGSSGSGLKRKRTDDHSAEVPPLKGLRAAERPLREDCPLRIHKHYRLVEEEVAMSLSEFQTGAQLVFVIYECIYAHFKAATDPVYPILHRDVSGGNVLIYPHIVYNDKVRAHYIQWSGLLADWEMSKPIGNEPEGKMGGLHAGQANRMGTLQFMSVALLSEPKSIEVCDELEAFFYVLLHYAARYLTSNLDEITLANYLDAFFDQYLGKNDGYTCGNVKRSTIETGKLAVANGLELRFGKPMDDLIGTLLGWLKSHYVVMNYKQRLEKERRQQGTQCLQFTDEAQKTVKVSNIPLFADEMDLPGQGSDPTLLAPRDEGQPSEHDWIDWEYVKTHRPVVKLFYYYLSAPWPVDDKVGDRLRTTWVAPSNPDVGSSRTKTMISSNKRCCRSRDMQTFLT